MRDYTGLNFCEIDELNIIEYYIFLRDSFIYSKYKTEQGTEYLRDCKMLTETETDVKGLREIFGRR